MQLPEQLDHLVKEEPALAPEREAAPHAQKATATAPSFELFGSFLLGDDEFALAASCIQEVVNLPDKITPIPLSPDYLAGVFTLRGVVIPVVDLAKIFNIAAPDASRASKIAIIDHEQVHIGILFHDTSAILRVRPEQRSLLQYRDPAIHGVIAGTIRLEDGARLVEILDPSALIRIENVPQIVELQAGRREEQGLHFRMRVDRLRCVSFHAGGAAFAVEMSAIQEIINVPEMKSSVMHSKLCVGRINLRGNAIVIVDFASVLNLPRTEATEQQRIVIARIGDAAVGLLVDSVDHIFSCFREEIMPLPLLSKARAGMFAGYINKEGLADIFLLNHDAIFTQGEIADLSHGHTNLYQQEAHKEAHTEAGRSQRESLHRKVYITFSLDQLFATEIKQIREIIDCPADMKKPPGAPEFVHGMIDLRHHVVAIIDLRTLYRMPAAARAPGAKILVIEHGDEFYGFMVDSVENIMSVADSDRIPVTEIMRNQANKDMRSEMREVIEMTAADGAHKTLGVFDIPAFLENLGRTMIAA